MARYRHVSCLEACQDLYQERQAGQKNMCIGLGWTNDVTQRSPLLGRPSSKKE